MSDQGVGGHQDRFGNGFFTDSPSPLLRDGIPLPTPDSVELRAVDLAHAAGGAIAARARAFGIDLTLTAGRLRRTPEQMVTPPSSQLMAS